MTQINTNKVGKSVGYQGAEVRPRRRGWLIWLVVHGGLAVGVAAWVWVMSDWTIYLVTDGGLVPDGEVPHDSRLLLSLLAGNVVSCLVLLPIWVGKVIWWKVLGAEGGAGVVSGNSRA